ncbi:unnamed protein product, partial [Acidocella sp. C78]
VVARVGHARARQGRCNGLVWGTGHSCVLRTCPLRMQDAGARGAKIVNLPHAERELADSPRACPQAYSDFCGQLARSQARNKLISLRCRLSP